MFLDPPGYQPEGSGLASNGPMEAVFVVQVRTKTDPLMLTMRVGTMVMVTNRRRVEYPQPWQVVEGLEGQRRPPWRDSPASSVASGSCSSLCGEACCRARLLQKGELEEPWRGGLQRWMGWSWMEGGSTWPAASWPGARHFSPQQRCP